MGDTLFRTYRAAAEYARKRAAATNSSPKIKRSGELWQVIYEADAEFDAQDDQIPPFDAPTPAYREPFKTPEEIVASRDNYRAMIAAKGMCYHCAGSGSGERGHLCSICKGRGYLDASSSRPQ